MSCNFFSASAQRECQSSLYLEAQKSSDNYLVNKLDAVENFIRLQSNSFARSGNTLLENNIRIPVVVHIIYNESSQNISDAQVKSQIDALNRDFKKQNSDTSNIPYRFQSLAANTEIEFVLATADPKGRATNGIVRKQTSVTEWRLDDKIKFNSTGGNDAWDSRYYLNIWVGNTRTTLGYSTTPGGDGAKDGIVINTTAFGTINTLPPFHLGRTATHEVGHWLGLRHIWGDTYCGDDLVHDTPNQGGFTSGCPTNFRSSCNNTETGDMYMNYMDYTNDACVNLFTNGQKTRMRSLFNAGGPRYTILQSKGLNLPWMEEAAPVEPRPAVVNLVLYPNPAITELTVSFDVAWIGKKFSIVNSTGAIVETMLITGKKQKLSLTSYKAGVYFIQAQNGRERIAEKFVKL